jgi:prevent-host-death family protein
MVEVSAMARKPRAVSQPESLEGGKAKARSHSAEPETGARRETPHSPDDTSTAIRAASATWSLKDAKAKLGEVMKRARDQGPQIVSVRGKPAAAIIDVDELERWRPSGKRLPLVEFLEGLHVDGLDLTRDSDFGREPEM